MKRSGASQEISDEDDEVKSLGSKLKKLKLHKKGLSGGGFGSQLLAEANPIVSAMLKQIKKKDRKFNELASKPLQHKVVYQMLSESIFEKVF